VTPCEDASYQTEVAQQVAQRGISYATKKKKRAARKDKFQLSWYYSNSMKSVLLIKRIFIVQLLIINDWDIVVMGT